MPVVFAPPDPFSAQVVADYAGHQAAEAGENRRSQERMNALRMHTEGGIAAGQMNMQSMIQSAQNYQRTQAMKFETDNQENAQIRQIQARREAQQSEQFHEWAMQDQKVSQQEMLRKSQMEMGLSEITSQVSQGNLTSDEAAEMVLQLKTGINRTDQRLKQQRAEHEKAIAAQEMEQTARRSAIQVRGSQMNAENFEGQTAEVTMPDGTKSKFAITGFNQFGPTWAQVKTEKAEDPQEKAAIKYEKEVEKYDKKFDSEVDAVRKIHDNRRKEQAEKVEPDMKQIFEEAVNNLKERGIEKPKDPSAKPQETTKAAMSTAEKIQNNPNLDPVQKAKGLNAVVQLKMLLNKPKEKRTEQENALGQQLTAQIISLTGG